MEFRIFQYPLPCDPVPSELNQFLNANRIASVNHYLVHDPGPAMVVFVVATASTTSAPQGISSRDSARVDYQKILSPDQFDLFSRLRDERKRIAETEGIPVYAVFTNAQLAEMIQSGSCTVGDLLKIEGIGQAKAEKFGPAMITLLQSP